MEIYGLQEQLGRSGAGNFNLEAKKKPCYEVMLPIVQFKAERSL